MSTRLLEVDGHCLMLSGLDRELWLIFALGFRQSSGDSLAMEEVAHDPVGDRPLAAVVDAMMVRAQPDVSRELQSTRGTQAHCRTNI